MMTKVTKRNLYEASNAIFTGGNEDERLLYRVIRTLRRRIGSR